jgi:hypothetical protein
MATAKTTVGQKNRLQDPNRRIRAGVSRTKKTSLMQQVLSIGGNWSLSVSRPLQQLRYRVDIPLFIGLSWQPWSTICFRGPVHSPQEPTDPLCQATPRTGTLSHFGEGLEGSQR